MRGDLINAAFHIIKEKPAYGVGLNMITLYISPLLKHAEFLRFIQPPHNMYLLVFSESGIFAFTLFLLMLAALLHATYKTLIKSDFMYSYLLVNFVQILILGSFDHYFITIVQTSLLFWLTLGLCMKYNLIK
jgi:O-antigen ligase